MPALEKSFRSFGHGLSTERGMNELDKSGKRERERKVAPLYERKSREIKASNFLRIVRRISRRTSSSFFLSPRRPTGGAVWRKKKDRGRVGSCFSRPDTRCQMQSAKRRGSRVKGIGWLAVAKRREERGGAKERRLPSLFWRNLAFQLFILSYQWHDEISAIRLSRLSVFVVRFLTKIPLICFYSLQILRTERTLSHKTISEVKRTCG